MELFKDFHKPGSSLLLKAPLNIKINTKLNPHFTLKSFFAIEKSEWICIILHWNLFGFEKLIYDGL